MPKSFNLALVAGEFHRERVMCMVDEARRIAAANALMVIEEVWVPGPMEKPLALKRMLQRPDIDAAVALGVIEQGETSHGIVMAHAVLNAIIALQLELMKPIGVGILGPEISPQQMDARVIPYSRSAVLAVRHMLGHHDLESISTDSSG